MIEPHIIEKLDEEVNRFREKYNLINTENLEKIAENEYGASVIETPLGLSSKWVKTDNGLFIFYHASFKPYEPLTLGHEIGHLAAGHHEGYNPISEMAEKEADYFSARLNGVSLLTLNLFRWAEAGLRFKDHFVNLFRYKQEIEKLQQKGVYEAFK